MTLGKAGEGVKYNEAALEVLRAAERPLTSREITEQAIMTGLINPRGKTPGQTMSATLYRLQDRPDVIKLEEQGNNRAKRGTVRWTLRPN